MCSYRKIIHNRDHSQGTLDPHFLKSSLSAEACFSNIRGVFSYSMLWVYKILGNDVTPPKCIGVVLGSSVFVFSSVVCVCVFFKMCYLINSRPQISNPLFDAFRRVLGSLVVFMAFVSTLRVQIRSQLREFSILDPFHD